MPPENHSFGRLNDQIQQMTAITSGDRDAGLKKSFTESKYGMVN
jgi:hypothetical protein